MTNVDLVRRNCNEPAGDSDFGDDVIQGLLDAHLKSSVNYASADLWRLKAAAMADLVDASEGNSRRSWSKSHEQALTMAKEFQRLGDEASTPDKSRPSARMRDIVRS